MGSVLTFAPRQAASIRKTPVAGATASIVIFPGIRYERRADEQDRKGEARRDPWSETLKDKPQH